MSSIKSIISSFLCSIFIFLIFSTAAFSNKPESESFILANGMKVLVITNRKVPAITHMVWYKVGSVDEKNGKSGLAHFLEHLMFKETKSLKSGEFTKLVSSNGGNNNAFTTQDSTSYFQTIAKEHMELAMRLEAERMVNLKFDKETIEKERDIILEERNMRVENDPRISLTEQMNSALFINHPYGKPVIGWKHEIKQLTLEDIRDFYKKHYAPSNAVLIISGDVTAEEVKPLAEKYFGIIPAQPVPERPFIKEPAHKTSLFVSLKDGRVKKSEWMRYYLAPSIISGKTEHALPLAIFSQILGGGETSRLYEELVIQKKIATEVATYYDEISLGETTLGIYITPGKNVPLEIINKAVESEIIKMLKSGATDEEIERAKRLIKAEAIYAQDGLKSMAFVYGFALALGIDEKYIENWPEKIGSVTKKQIMDAASYVLMPERSVTGILIPE